MIKTKENAKTACKSGLGNTGAGGKEGESIIFNSASLRISDDFSFNVSNDFWLIS